MIRDVSDLSARAAGPPIPPPFAPPSTLAGVPVAGCVRDSGIHPARWRPREGAVIVLALLAQARCYHRPVLENPAEEQRGG